MNVERFKRPEVLWLLLAGCVLLAAFAWASWTVVAKYRQASVQLADIGPRYARLAGMLQNKELFAQPANALTANLAQFVYPASDDASQTGNTALQKVRDLATARGLRVASSQSAAPRDEKGFDRIDLALRVEGSWPDLVATLRELTQQHPAIFINTLQLGVQRHEVQGVAQLMFGQLDLYVLRERAP
ncbi:type II secretion system protein GspM [Ottowia pentelensis]|uniref:Type II secretion system protein GspM n=1 Tax=Ottowia pentelensis TaxID=511108 RepID=A0ABV6PR45_9BURK